MHHLNQKQKFLLAVVSCAFLTVWFFLLNLRCKDGVHMAAGISHQHDTRKSLY